MNLIKKGLALDKYNSAGYIYLLQEREFVKTGEEIYKIGKTKNISRRMKEYPKYSLIILILQVKNSDEFERRIINRFKAQFKLYDGREYFCGSKNQMIGIILDEYHSRGEYIEPDIERDIKPQFIINNVYNYIGGFWKKIKWKLY